MTKPLHTRLLRRARGSLSNWTAAYWGVAILIAALYAVLSALVPYSLDDWTFMGNWRDDARGGMDFSFGAWWRYYDFIRGYDNGRLANAVSPLSTMFSPWKEIFPIITGLLMALNAILLRSLTSPRVSPARPSALLFLAMIWALMIIGLPWRDTLFVRDYSLNYIWAASLNLLFLFLLLRGEKGGWNSRLFLCAVIVALLAGGWHESFAVATLCGVALLAVMRRFRFSPQFYIAFGLLLLSTLAFMLSPGMIARIGASMADGFHHRSIRTFFILVVFGIVVLFCAFVPSGRKALKSTFGSSEGIVATGITVSGYAIALLTVQTARSFFWPDMGVIALIAIIVARYPGTFNVRLTSFAAIFVILLCTAQTVAVIVWQRKYTREAEEIMALLGNSGSGTVFYDSRLPQKAPFYTLEIPAAGLWRNPYHYIALKSYFITPVIGVVPTELRNADAAKMETDTVGMTVPEIRDGFLVIPFVTERGDTLLYREPF